MEYLALSIFVSTVLFLVDRNHAWPKFWRVTKWTGALVLAIALLIGGYSYWSRRHVAAHETFYDVQPITPSH